MILFFQTYYHEMLVALFACITLIVLIYYFALFMRFVVHQKGKNKKEEMTIDFPPVSIIVPAFNDAHFLRSSLPVLLTQTYPDYEVLVVNYNSIDETANILEDYSRQFQHLTIINIDSAITKIKGKKFPLSIGIKEAKHELLLFSNPEGRPSSLLWLEKMSQKFVQKKEIIVGYATYKRRKGLFDYLLHYSQLQNAIIRFSFTLAKMPIYADGNNLAYARKLFDKQKGYAPYNHIFAGDDDVFVNRAAKKKGKGSNCTIEVSPQSIVVSQLRYNFKRWFIAERRKSYAQKYYKRSHKFVLDVYLTNAFLFYVAFALALYFSYPIFPLLIITGSIFLLKTILQYIIFGICAKRLNEKQVIPFILLWDLLFIIITPFIALFKKK